VDGIGSSQRRRGGFATGHCTWHDIAILVIGLAAGALVTVTAVRRHRIRTAQRFDGAVDGHHSGLVGHEADKGRLRDL
jgi:hypothetical protein